MGQQRRFQPKVFEQIAGPRGLQPITASNIETISTFRVECDIAQRAFDAALKGERVPRDWDRKEDIEGLDADYRKYGLSSGLRTTLELVRQLEQDAAKQAEEHRGAGARSI